MKRNRLWSLALMPLVLALSSCASDLAHPVSDSTLNGETVVGDGVTIRELSSDEFSTDDLSPQGLIRQDENSFIFEYGGSGSAACASNFIAIERAGDEFTLTHRVGDGTAEFCTEDYRFTYFLVEANEPIGDEAVAKVFSNDELVRTLGFGTSNSANS